MDDLRRYADRMVVPLVLLGAAIVLWLISSLLGGGVTAAVEDEVDDVRSDVPMTSVRRAPLAVQALVGLVDELRVSITVEALPADE